MKVKELIERLKEQHKQNKSKPCVDTETEEIYSLEMNYQKQYKSLLCKEINHQIKINERLLSDKFNSRSSNAINVYKEYKLYSSLTKLRITPQFNNDSSSFNSNDYNNYMMYFTAPGKIKLLSSKDTIEFWNQLSSFLSNPNHK